MNKRLKLIAAALAVTVAFGASAMGARAQTEGETRQGGRPPRPAGMARRAYWRLMGIRSTELQISVKDASTMKGIPGAGCTIAETSDRVETNKDGVAPTIHAPVFRNPRVEELLQEIHGALTVICYKKGYRDAVYIGLRMYEGVKATPEVWMYRVGDEDRRIEPTVFDPPEHRTWLIQLADKYRLFDEGEGPERPELSRPDRGQISPQETMGGGIQTPVFTGPPEAQRQAPGRPPQTERPAPPRPERR